MPIPDFQTVMLPLLRLLGDGQERGGRERVEALAGTFNLSADERRTLLSSGRQPVFDNRVAWATTYLTKAGLVERPARNRVRITERGRQVLSQHPARIDIGFLSRFPEFVEFRRRPDHTADDGDVAISGGTEPTVPHVPQVPPDEMLEESYQRLRQSLAQELLYRIMKSPSSFFERLVVDLLVAMGYGGSRHDAGQAVGSSGDGGIDGIIKEDRLGLDFVYLQAKRWDGPVSRPVVQAFAGSLEGQRARKGVMITTSKFTRDAQDYVTRIEKRIVLIDGEQLAQLMIDHGVGVTDVATYHVKKVDADYFGDE